MELTFDFRGNLQPYKRNSINLIEFQTFFVDPFDQNSSRHLLFNNYQKYLEDFAQEIGPNFVQWLNGSFVTNEKNPNDIDFVTLLDFQTIKEKEEVISQKFIAQQALDLYNLDAYILRIYPEEHSFHNRTKADMAYWNHWFGQSKLNRSRKRFPKGFIEIEFKAS